MHINSINLEKKYHHKHVKFELKNTAIQKEIDKKVFAVQQSISHIRRAHKTLGENIIILTTRTQPNKTYKIYL